MADISPTAAQVLAQETPQPQLEDGTAGEALTAGQWVYADGSDSGKFKLADNDNGAARATMRGICLANAAAGQPIRIARNGTKVKLSNSNVLTIGTPYFLSSTAGAICPFADLTAGDFVVQAGIAVSQTEIQITLINSGVAVPA